MLEKRRRVTAGALIAVAIVLAGAWAAQAVFASETTLTFRIRDAVSRGWVWDASITLQGREVKAFYQSDSGLVDFTFTDLQPGTWELRASAPHYESEAMSVTLRRGANSLDAPIELTGYEIPDLSRFVVFERLEGGDIVSELRPVTRDGNAVRNHPCLDIWVGARVSVQMKEGVPVRESTASGSSRGTELFRGEIEWTWDDRPETAFRYHARIPGSRIEASQAPFWVVDYLILVPDPRRTTSGELESIASAAWAMERERLLDYLDQRAGERFDYYLATSWNVQGGRL